MTTDLAHNSDTHATKIAPATPVTPVKGIHKNIPFDQYLRWPIISQSILKRGRESMAHMKAAIDGELVIEPTDDMTLGSALHTVFLEPEHALDRIVRWDGGVRRSKAWDAFKAEHDGQLILTDARYAQLQGMVRSLRSHPEVIRWRGKIEAVEVSCIGEVHGLRMKGRIDALTSDPIVDLKKVASADMRLFRKRAYQFGYHIQAAVYCELFQRSRFMLLIVEDQPPHDVTAFELSKTFLDHGRAEMCELIDRVHQCQQTGVWPGRSSTVESLDLPEWASDGSEDHQPIPETEIVF